MAHGPWSEPRAEFATHAPSALASQVLPHTDPACAQLFSSPLFWRPYRLAFHGWCPLASCRCVAMSSWVSLGPTDSNHSLGSPGDSVLFLILHLLSPPVFCLFGFGLNSRCFVCAAELLG